MPPQTPATNSVQISISAVDAKATETIKQVGVAFDKVKTSSELAQAKVVLLSGAIASLTLKGAASVNTLAAAFGNLTSTIRGVANTQVGDDTLFGLIQKQAEAALNQTQKLSDVIKSVEGLPSAAVKGALLGDKGDPLKEIEGKFEGVAQKITGKLVDGFTNIPVSQIPFLNNFLSQNQLTQSVGFLDKTLSEIVLNKLIKNRIPGALKGVLEATLGKGLIDNIAGGIAGALKSPIVGGALSSSGKQLVGGTFLGFLESRISNFLVQGFKNGFVLLDSFLQSQAKNIGVEIGKSLFATGEGEDKFGAIDQLFGGQLSQNIDAFLPGLGEKIAELSKVKELVAGIGGELALLTSGSLAAFATGGIGGAFLGNAAAGAAVAGGPLDNVMTELIRKFSGGLVEGLGNAVFRFTKAPEAAEMLVNFVAVKALGGGIKSFIGMLPTLLYNPLKKQIPDQFKGIFQIIESLVVPQAGAIAQVALKQIGKVFGGGAGLVELFDRITKTPVQRFQKQIEELQKLTTTGPLQSISQLQQEATNTALNPNIASGDRQARIDEINQLIETIEKETQVRTQIEALTEQMNELLEKPQKLQQEAINAALNSALTSEERSQLVESINQQIEQAQRDIDLSPLQQFADKINKLVFGPLLGNKLGATLFESIKVAFTEINDFFDGAFTDAMEILGNNAGSAFRSGLSQGILEGLGPILDEIDSGLRDIVDFAKDIPAQFAQPLEGIGNAFGYLSGVRDPIGIFDQLKTGASEAFGAISRVGEQITFFQSGLQTVQSVIMGGPFQLLIGQNIELRQQLLSTQSTLASTSKVISKVDGTAISDPLKAIMALESPVSRAMENVRKGSLELVGVTSNQLIESFDIIAGQASQIGLSLDQSSDLTLSFAAALGTLGIPLSMARQEITSIVTGQIDQNSALAKSINLTNEQIRTWKQQGNVFEKLTERLEAFRAGNKLAAQTVGGISSNIQEIFETIGRKAGEPLLDPIVKELDMVYRFLEQNQDAIVEFVSDISLQVFNALKSVFDATKEILSPLQGLATSLPRYLADSLSNTMQKVAEAAKTTVAVLQPFINVFIKLFEVVRPIGGPLLEFTLKAKALQFGIATLGSAFGTLANILPGVGEVMFGLNVRMLPLVNMFPTLTGLVGQGGAGFLLLGKHLNQIPVISGVVSRSLGPLGPMLVGFIPAIAGIGIQVAGLAAVFPPLKTALMGVLAQNPADLVAKLAALTKLVPGLGFLGTTLDGVSLSLRQMAGNMSVAEFATVKFKETLKLAFIELRKMAINLVFLGAALFLAFKAIDKFVLKNEDLIDGLIGVGEGLKTTAAVLIELAQNPAFQGMATIIGLVALQMSGLYGWLVKILALQVAGWLGSVATLLQRVGTFLGLIKLQGLAAGANQAAVGFRALSVALTQGNVASAQFLANQGTNVVTLSSLKTSALTTAGSIQKFAVSMLKGANSAIAFTTSLPGTIAGMGATSAAAGGSSFSFSTFAASVKSAALSLIGMGGAAGSATPPTVGAGVAAGAASTGFATLATAVGSVIGGLVTLLLPLAAIGAALGAIGLIVYSKQLADSTEATQILGESTGVLSEQSIKLQVRVKAAQAAQEEKAKNGIILTKEEIAANQALLDQVGRTTEEIKMQIETLKEQQAEVKGKGNKEAIASQIKELELRLKSLEETANSVDIAPRDLAKLGTVYQQLANKVIAAEVAIKQAAGDPAIFKTKAQELIDLTSQQLKLGQITGDEARRRFELLSSNAVAEQDVQLKAQQAITESYATENERRAKLSESTIAQIQTQVQEGQVSETEGDRLVTEEKILQVDRRIAAIRQQYQVQADLRKKELDEELKAIAQEKEAANADLKIQQKGGDAKRIQEAQEVLDKLEEREAEYRNKKAIADSKAREDESNELKAAESERAQLAAQERKRSKELALQDYDEQLVALEEQRSQYLMGEDEFSKAVLQNRQARINAEINQQEASFNKLAATDKEGREQIAANINKLQKEASDLEVQERKRVEQLRLQDYDEQLANAEKLRSQLLIGEDEYSRQVVAIRQARIDAEISQQKQELNRLAKDDKEGREQILANINKLQKEAGDLEVQERKRIEQLRLQDYDEQIAQLEASYAKRLMGEEEYLSQSAALQEERINLEIEQQRSQLNRLAKDDKEGREAIASAIASLEKKKSEIQLAERKRRQQLLVEDFNEELALLRASYASGEMSEIEFARRSIALRNQQKDLQIAQAKEELNLLATTDKEGRERILAQIAQYEAEKADLQAEAHAAEVQQIERAQEEALRAVTAAEQSRLIELQKLYNSGALRASAFEEKKLQASLTRIKAELDAEKDKLAALEALPPLSDPAKERERQKQIFDIRSKIAGQTLQLLQTEEQAYRAYIARIREALEQQNQRIANQIERQNQALQQQTMLYNALGTALSNQNKLLDARRSLSKASADFVIGSLDTISKLETSEFRRQKLAEATATIRLKALQQELEYERQSVMLNQQQNALALEREKIQNRIAQAQAQAEVAGIDAEIAIAKLDRQTTPEQLEALRLKRSATVQKVQGLQQEAGFLEERGAIESQSNQMELQTLALRQQNQQNSAIADIISSLPEGKRNRYAREFQNQLAQQLGAGSKAELIQQGKVTTQNQLAQLFPTIGRGGAGNPLEMFDPRLEGLQGAASSSAMNNAYNDTGIRYGIRYGLTGMGLAAGGGLATGKELSLPSDFMAQPLGTPTIALPPAMPASQDKPLMLPSLDQKGFTLAGNALQLSSESFTRGVDKFAEIVDTLKAGQTAGVTLNANITIPVQADTKSVGESAKKEVSRQLNDLVRKMEVQFN